MSMLSKEQYGAYASNASGAPIDENDGREIDRRALLNCAARLNVALADGGKDMKAYAEAIHHNQRLWTLFQVALCDQENPLPKHLKAILLNLSRYVDRTSFRAITEFAPQLLHSLIDVNRTIAAGLNKKQTAAKPSQHVQQAPMQPPPTDQTSSVMTTA